MFQLNYSNFFAILTPFAVALAYRYRHLAMTFLAKHPTQSRLQRSADEGAEVLVGQILKYRISEVCHSQSNRLFPFTQAGRAAAVRWGKWVTSEHARTTEDWNERALYLVFPYANLIKGDRGDPNPVA